MDHNSKLPLQVVLTSEFHPLFSKLFSIGFTQLGESNFRIKNLSYGNIQLDKFEFHLKIKSQVDDPYEVSSSWECEILN